MRGVVTISPENAALFASRLVPARSDLAAAHLKGQVDADRFTRGYARAVDAPLLDLFASLAEDAERATQLLYGERFVVYEWRDDGRAWGQAELDGYVGFVEAGKLGMPRPKGPRVTALSSHCYARARHS